MNHRRVAIHGATGTQGRSIAQAAVRSGWDVTAIARGSGAPADHEPIDAEDAEALALAYKGADAVVVQLPLVFDPARIQRQVDAIVTAVAAAEAPRVVLNTNAPIPPVEIGIPFVDGRVRLAARLRDSVGTFATVAPLFAYMENLLIPASQRRIGHDGEVAYPIPHDFAMPWVATDDVADAVVDLLDSANPEPVRHVAGPAFLTGDETAAELSAAIGRPVRWTTIDHTEYAAMIVPTLGEEAGAGIASFYAAAPAAIDVAGVPGLVAAPTTLRDWAAKVTWD